MAADLYIGAKAVYYLTARASQGKRKMAEKERHQCNGEEGGLLISRTDENWNAGFSFDRLREYKEEHGH